MTTKAKPWPKKAEFARLDTIAGLNKIIQEADQLIMEDTGPIETMRAMVRVKDRCTELIDRLNQVKAQPGSEGKEKEGGTQ